MVATETALAHVYDLAARDGLAYVDGELYLPDANLWLDSRRRRPKSFVSHAHSDHIARHALAVLSPPTASLYAHRAGRSPTLSLPYRQPVPMGRATVELLPAGHILGSAQLLLTRPDGRRVVYTGDFKLRSHACNQPADVVRADVLVMEATYGEPFWRFPSAEEVARRLLNSVARALARGATPLVLGYPLGKAQVALHVLSHAGLRVQVQPQVMPYVRLYEQHGIQFGAYERLDIRTAAGSVVVASAGSQRTRLPSLLGSSHTVMLSGWGLDPRARYRYGVDEMIPMSDHADFDELVEYVRACAPTRVYTVHGTPEFARHLREQGLEAYHLPAHQPSLFDV